MINGKSFARGEVVTVDGFYGIHVTEITGVNEHIRSLNT